MFRMEAIIDEQAVATGINNVAAPPSSNERKHPARPRAARKLRLTSTVNSVKTFLAQSAQKSKPEPKMITLQDGIQDALEKFPESIPPNMHIPTVFYQFCDSEMMRCFLDAVLKYFKFYTEELKEKALEAKRKEQEGLIPAGSRMSATGTSRGRISTSSTLHHFNQHPPPAGAPMFKTAPVTPQHPIKATARPVPSFKTAPTTPHRPLLVGYRSPFQATSSQAQHGTMKFASANKQSPIQTFTRPATEDGFTPQGTKPGSSTAQTPLGSWRKEPIDQRRLQRAGFRQLSTPQWPGIPEHQPTSHPTDHPTRQVSSKLTQSNSGRRSSQRSVSRSLSSSALQRRHKRNLRCTLLAAVAKSYSALLLHCSNYENSLGDQRFFEVLLCFVSVVVKEVFGDMSAHFKEVDAEIDRLFRGGTLYFNPLKYQPFEMPRKDQENPEEEDAKRPHATFRIPKQGDNMLPALEDWENRSIKVSELAEANISSSMQLRQEIGLAKWRSQHRRKKKSLNKNLPKGYINSKVYNKSPVLMSILPDKGT